MNFLTEESLVLNVRGNGLKDAGINDGDLIHCKKADCARDGDIVFASIQDKLHEAKILARYRKAGRKIHLCMETDDPCCPSHIEVLPKHLKILGIFQNVIKWK